MDDSSVEGRFLSDSALEHPEQDRLGYSPFSEDLAGFIHDEIPSTEFVIGIYGEWGSGKSTILEFLEFYLRQRDNPPLVIKFNPWWFSDQADLIEKFFAELESGLATDSQFENSREHIQKFTSALSRDRIQKIASALSKVPSSVTGGLPVDSAAEAVNAWLDSDVPPLGEIKEDISENLQNSDRKVIVLIDDIDRLTEDEIRQMFRLVKSVADFPNIIYVLAFDQEVVIKALDGEQGPGNGEEYLEKIIQLPQHVPIPEEGTLRSFFLENLDLLLGNDNRNWDESRWQGAYSKAIVPIIQTPRDAVRLSNSIKGLYFKVGENVNFVDLVIVEVLRVFYRPVYEEIRDRKDDFVVQRSHIEISDDQYAFLSDDFNEEERERIKTLLGYLFPQYGTSASSIHLGDLRKYRKQKRICHPDMYPYYFRQSIPQGEIPISEMKSIVESTNNVDEFSEKLLDLSNEAGREHRSKANTFLQRFEGYTDEIPRERIDNLLVALFIVGDRLILEDPSRSMLDNGSDSSLFRIILNLLKRINHEGRHSVLSNAIQEGNSVYLPTYFIILMLQEHGEYRGEERDKKDRTFDSEQIAVLKENTVNKIKELADSGDLVDTPHLHRVLKRWHEWGVSEEVENWSEETFSNRQELLNLLSGMVQVGTTSTSRTVSKTEYINPDNIEPYLEISFVEDRLNEIDDEELSEDEKEVVRQFIEGIERIEKGKDPGDFGSWSQGERKEDEGESGQ